MITNLGLHLTPHFVGAVAWATVMCWTLAALPVAMFAPAMLGIAVGGGLLAGLLVCWVTTGILGVIPRSAWFENDYR